jgi:hypothetical protein
MVKRIDLMRPIVTHALEFGLVLSAVLFGLLLVVLRANPEIMLNDYPPDIRARWGPMSERTKRQRVLVAVAFLAVILGVVAWSFESFPVGRCARRDLCGGICALRHHVRDLQSSRLVVLDLGLVHWQPRFAVLPGTEGMAGYGNHWFHFRGFLIGIPIVLAGSALCAAVVSMLA